MFSFAIGTITNVRYIYIYIYNFYQTKIKPIQFLSRIQKVSENINFLVKLIYSILCTIKMYIKFRNY